MVTSTHEASHRIFQDRPELLAPIFRILGLPLAEKAAVEVLTPDATEIRPLERRVDSVLRVEPPGGETFLLAIEAQGRRDPAKAASWTYYLAYLRAKYETPALLLVVCQDEGTAAWAAGPFTTGVDGWTALSTHPLVLGPDNVPVITDPDEAARDLTLATFCAITHGRDRDIEAILKALARALGSIDGESAKYYIEMLDIGLGNTQAQETWREMMSVPTYFPGRGTIIEQTYLMGKAEGKAEGEAKGKAEGKAVGQAEAKAQAILKLLWRRGIAIPPNTQRVITSCTDLETLDLWFDRAIIAKDIGDLFAIDETKPAT